MKHLWDRLVCLVRGHDPHWTPTRSFHYTGGEAVGAFRWCGRCSAVLPGTEQKPGDKTP